MSMPVAASAQLYGKGAKREQGEVGGSSAKA